MLDQINWLIDYYDNNPNVDPNVAEFMDRLIGCVEELKNTKSEQAKLELKRAISILARSVVNRCSSRGIITDDAVLQEDTSNYSLTYRSDFEYDRACMNAFRDFQPGKKQDPMFGAISSLIGRIKDDENISKEELNYARLLLEVYFHIKQEQHNKGEVFYSNVTQFFELSHLDALAWNKMHDVEKYSDMFKVVNENINPLAKAEEIKNIYVNNPKVDPNFFELLAVFYTLNRKNQFCDNLELVGKIKVFEISRLYQNGMSLNDSTLEDLINNAYDVILQSPNGNGEEIEYAIAKAAGVALYLCQERKKKEEKEVRFDNESEYKTLCSFDVNELARKAGGIYESCVNVARCMLQIIGDAQAVYMRTKNRSLTPGEEPQHR